VSAGGDAQGRFVALGQKIGKHKADTPFFHYPAKVFESLPDIRSRVLRLEIQELSYDVQDVLPPLLGRNKPLDLIAEKEDTYFVVIVNGRKGQGGSYLDDDLRFQLLLGAEKSRAGDIDQQHDGQFTFFLKHFHVGFAGAGSHVPVDISHIVTVLIVAYLTERHTPTLKGTVVFTRKEVLAQSLRLDLDPPYFPQ
jgi:hypothetical protein